MSASTNLISVSIEGKRFISMQIIMYIAPWLRVGLRPGVCQRKKKFSFKRFTLCTHTHTHTTHPYTHTHLSTHHTHTLTFINLLYTIRKFREMTLEIVAKCCGDVFSSICGTAPCTNAQGPTIFCERFPKPLRTLVNTL